MAAALGAALPGAGSAVTESERAAAVELIEGLIRCKLVAKQQAVQQLVATPLQQLWDESGSGGGNGDDGSGGGGGGSSASWDAPRLRMLLDLSDSLLVGGLQQSLSGSAKSVGRSHRPAAASPQALQPGWALLRPADWWCVALGLSAAVEQLGGGAAGGGRRQQVDLVGVAQAQKVREVLVGAAAGAVAPPLGVRLPLGAAAKAPATAGGLSLGMLVEGLADLPWAHRLALLPLVEAVHRCSGVSVAAGGATPCKERPLSPRQPQGSQPVSQLEEQQQSGVVIEERQGDRALWQHAQELLQPAAVADPTAGSPAGGQGVAVELLRQLLAFAASSEQHAMLLARAHQNTPAGASCSGSSGTASSLNAVYGGGGGDNMQRTGTFAKGGEGDVREDLVSSVADRIAMGLAAAAKQVPGDLLRRALLLALGEFLPFATEACAGRVLFKLLPELLACRVALAASTGSCEEPHHLQHQQRCQQQQQQQAPDRQQQQKQQTQDPQQQQQQRYRKEQYAAEDPLTAHHKQQTQDQQQQQQNPTLNDPQLLALSAAVQLTCRAVYVILALGRWARNAPPEARQQAADQCFRHVNALALHTLQQAAQPAGAAAHGMARVCLRECCRLVAALRGLCDVGAMQALLLRLVSDICRVPLAVIEQQQQQQAEVVVEEGQEQREQGVREQEGQPQPQKSDQQQQSLPLEAEEGSAAHGQPQQQEQQQMAAGQAARSRLTASPGPLQLSQVMVAPIGQPFDQLLTWTVQQVELVPGSQRALLLPALVHVASGAAAKVARGGFEVAEKLQEEVEELVEKVIVSLGLEC